MSYYLTPLDEVFVGRIHHKTRILYVKVIKQVSPQEFLVADATGFRKIQIRGIVLHQNKRYLRENHFVKITRFLVDYDLRKVFLHMATEISRVRGFPVDETKPAANVCTYIYFLLDF